MIKKILLWAGIIGILVILLVLYFSPDKVEYYPNGGIKAKYSLVLGKIEGEYVAYYQNGNIKEIVNYHKDIQHGRARFFFENGQPEQELHYKNGELVDSVKIYHPTGYIKELRIVENGKYWLYYDDGTLQEKGQKVNGLYDGIIESYSTEGSLSSFAHYEKGAEQILISYSDSIQLFDYENQVNLVIPQDWEPNLSLREDAALFGASSKKSSASMILSKSDYNVNTNFEEILRKDFDPKNFEYIQQFTFDGVRGDQLRENGYLVYCEGIVNEKEYKVFSYAIFTPNDYYVLSFFCPEEVFNNLEPLFLKIGRSLMFIVDNKRGS